MNDHRLLAHPRGSMAGLLVFFLLLAPACDGDDDDSADPGDPTGDEFQITVTPSETIATVATISWSVGIDDVESAYLEFGADTGYGHQAPATSEEDGSYSALVLGMRAGTEVHYRAVVVSDGETSSSDDGTFVTGEVPNHLPELAADDAVTDWARASGGYFVGEIFPGYPVIFDSEGQYVWWYDQFDDTLDITRTWLSHDGESILCDHFTSWPQGGNHDESRFVARIRLDGSEAEQMTFPATHHDFLELPDGTLVLLEFDPKEIDGENVDSDVVVEYAPDGTRREVWSLWDAVPWDPEHPAASGDRYGHCNAIDYDVEQDVYYVSSRNFSTIFKIDRATGDTLMKIGGELTDFEMAGVGNSWFRNQHQFQFIDNGLIVFNNGVDGETSTTAIEYSIDYDAMTSHMVWEHQPDPELGCFALGDVNRMPNGNTLVVFSTAGQMEEVTEDGEVVWRLNLPLGGGFGYFQWVPSLYGVYDSP